jgi:photosystem II stability/assembly factor-like uncharacterized protein
MSSFDPKVLYMGSSMVFRSADRGLTWTAISPDLTANIDRETLQMMGGPVPADALSRHDGQTSYSTLTTIGESPLDANLLYTGSDDGQLQVTRDGGRQWTNITARVPGLPANAYVSSVLPSRHAKGRVYATFDNHYNDDYHPYVFVSNDYGQSWRAIAATLPETAVHRLREDPKNEKLLVLGHERGLHVSMDGGATWTPFNANMPNVPVDDLLIHPRDNALVLGTHGRSLWVLDDIGPLEALTPDAVERDAFLVPAPHAQLLSMYNPQAWYGAGQFFAPNPDAGAAIVYYLREPAKGDVTVDIRDAGGSLVRSLKGAGKRGLNRVTWDLRLEPLPAGERSGGGGGFGGTPNAPLVLPGTYHVAVGAGAHELKGDLVVDGDPRTSFTDADRRTRQDALVALYELEKTLAAARASARALDAQTGAIRKDIGKAVPPLDKLAERVTKAASGVNAQMNTASGLSRAIEGYSGLPTADQLHQIDWAYEDAGEAVASLNAALQEAPAVFADLMKAGTWPAHAAPIQMPKKK